MLATSDARGGAEDGRSRTSRGSPTFLTTRPSATVALAAPARTVRWSRSLVRQSPGVRRARKRARSDASSRSLTKTSSIVSLSRSIS